MNKRRSRCMDQVAETLPGHCQVAAKPQPDLHGLPWELETATLAINANHAAKGGVTETLPGRCQVRLGRNLTYVTSVTTLHAAPARN